MKCHQRMVHITPTFDCDVCGEKSKCNTTLQRHKTIHAKVSTLELIKLTKEKARRIKADVFLFLELSYKMSI